MMLPVLGWPLATGLRTAPPHPRNAPAAPDLDFHPKPDHDLQLCLRGSDLDVLVNPPLLQQTQPRSGADAALQLSRWQIVINTSCLAQEITKGEQVTWRQLLPTPSHGDVARGSTRSLEQHHEKAPC